MAERVALQCDRAAAVATRLHRVAEGRRDVAEPGLKPVADAAEPVDPGVSRRVGLGMADHHRRRVGRGVRGDDAIESILVEAHVGPLHVAPGAGAADVDPAVERAHRALPSGVRRGALRVGWWVGEEAFRAFMAQTMPHARSPVHRTMFRGVCRRLCPGYAPLAPPPLVEQGGRKTIGSEHPQAHVNQRFTAG